MRASSQVPASRVWSRSLLLSLIAALGSVAESNAVANSPIGSESGKVTVSSRAPHGTTKLVLLGTAGGPTVRAERSQPASMLTVDGHHYLVDVGDGTVQRLYQAGVDTTQLDAIFLTHLHLDHTLGLVSLLGFRWVARSGAPLPIYGPPGTEELVAGAYAVLKVPVDLHAIALPPGPPMNALAEVHRVDVIGPQVIFHDQRIQVTAVENSHYEFFAKTDASTLARPYGHDRSYALRFDTAARSIVFTGDTGPSAAVEALASGADILVAETLDHAQTEKMFRAKYPGQRPKVDLLMRIVTQGHLVPIEIAKMGARSGVKMIVLNHFVPGPDGDKAMDRFRTEMRPYFSGPIVAGRDLQQF